MVWKARSVGRSQLWRGTKTNIPTRVPRLREFKPNMLWYGLCKYNVWKGRLWEMTPDGKGLSVVYVGIVRVGGTK